MKLMPRVHRVVQDGVGVGLVRPARRRSWCPGRSSADLAGRNWPSRISVMCAWDDANPALCRIGCAFAAAGTMRGPYSRLHDCRSACARRCPALAAGRCWPVVLARACRCSRCCCCPRLGAWRDRQRPADPAASPLTVWLLDDRPAGCRCGTRPSLRRPRQQQTPAALPRPPRPAEPVRHHAASAAGRAGHTGSASRRSRSGRRPRCISAPAAAAEPGEHAARRIRPLAPAQLRPWTTRV